MARKEVTFSATRKRSNVNEQESAYEVDYWVGHFGFNVAETVVQLQGRKYL